MKPLYSRALETGLYGPSANRKGKRAHSAMNSVLADMARGTSGPSRRHRFALKNGRVTLNGKPLHSFSEEKIRDEAYRLEVIDSLRDRQIHGAICEYLDSMLD